MDFLNEQILKVTNAAKGTVDNILKRKWVQSPPPNKRIVTTNTSRAKWEPPKAEIHPDSESSFVSIQNCEKCPLLQSDLNKLRGEKQGMKSQIQHLKTTIASISQQNKHLKAVLINSQQHRRAVNQQLMQLKGRIRLYCRIKPTQTSVVSWIEFDQFVTSLTVSRAGVNKTFFFDRVFLPKNSQEEIFQEIKSYIESATDGEKVCLFSYGQTGSGKTYTMQGNLSENDPGILPRAGAFIFKEIHKKQLLSDFQIHISALEIYRDNLTDLLGEPGSKIVLRSTNTGLDLAGLTWIRVFNSEELLNCISRASSIKKTRSTHMNSASSRSHTIYQIRIDGRGSEEVHGKILIIDLAGSQRPNEESYEGKSARQVEEMKLILEEAKHINKSLSTLRRCIGALINRDQGGSEVPPYRDCKLTRIVQDSLSQGKLGLILAISPDNARESLQSLNFGDKAQMVKKS